MMFEPWMQEALTLAEQARDLDEVPVGAVVVMNDQIIGRGFNCPISQHDPTAHAEILAITQAAASLGDWRLSDTIMYVTKEPCPMCAGAIVQARIPIVVWGMTDPFRGGACSLINIFDNEALNHRVRYYPGIMEEECKDLMQSFFKRRRE